MGSLGGWWLAGLGLAGNSAGKFESRAVEAGSFIITSVRVREREMFYFMNIIIHYMVLLLVIVFWIDSTN